MPDPQDQSQPEQNTGPAPIEGKAEDREYEIYAPPDSYNPDIKAGDIKLLVLEGKSDSFHANLVQHIARLSSEQASEEWGAPRPQIFVRTGSLGPQAMQGTVPLLQEADVVNFSAGMPSDIRINIAYSGNKDPSQQLENLTRPIVVQAAGNYGNIINGNQNRISFEVPTAEDIQFYRYAIKVGEATQNPDGTISVDKHSAREGVSFLAFNRTEQGAKYLFYEMSDLENMSPESRKKVTIDEDGYVSNIQGTSFVAPNVAGALAAAKSAYPDLSNSELIAAALASGKIPDLSDPEIVRTTAGLNYGEYKYGYGVFDPKAFEKNLEVVNSIKAKNGNLRDIDEMQTDFERSKIERDGVVYNAHTFKFDEEMTVEKITLFAHVPVRTYPASQMIVISPSGKEVQVPVSVGSGLNRLTTDAFLGEAAKGEWKILTRGDGEIPGSEIDTRISFGPEETKGLYERPAATFRIYGQEIGPNGQSNISQFLETIEAPMPTPKDQAIEVLLEQSLGEVKPVSTSNAQSRTLLEASLTP